MKLSIALATVVTLASSTNALDDGTTPVAKEPLPVLRELAASSPRILQTSGQVQVFNTDKCFERNPDVGVDAGDDGYNVYAKACDETGTNLNQVFEYDEATLEIKVGGFCLGAALAGTYTDNVYAFECNQGAKNQRWVYDRVAQELRNLENAFKCLDMALSGFEPPITNQLFNLYMFNCSGDANQKFIIPPEWNMLSPRDIIFDGVTTDFSADSENELVLTYNIGAAFDELVGFATYASDCSTPISPVNLVVTSDSIMATDTVFDTYTLRHNIDTSLLAGSNIFDGADKVTVCQVVQLRLDNGRDLIIAEDKQVVVIDLTFQDAYTIEDSPVVDAAPEGAVDTTSNVNGYLEACQCSGDLPFQCDIPADPLLPNDELVVCIYTTSPDVSIDSLDSMAIFQDDPEVPVFGVIDANAVAFPTITTLVTTENVVIVRTEVPSNKVTFATGEVIDVSGTATLQFDSGRRLRADVRTMSSDPKDETDSFDLEVELMASDEDSSSSAVAKKGAIGAAFGLVFAMMW